MTALVLNWRGPITAVLILIVFAAVCVWVIMRDPRP